MVHANFGNVGFVELRYIGHGFIENGNDVLQVQLGLGSVAFDHFRIQSNLLLFYFDDLFHFDDSYLIFLQLLEQVFDFLENPPFNIVLFISFSLSHLLFRVNLWSKDGEFITHDAHTGIRLGQFR